MAGIFKPVLIDAPLAGVRRNIAGNQLGDREWWTLDNFEIRNGELRTILGATNTGKSVSGVPSLIGAAKYGDATYQSLIATNAFAYQFGNVMQQLNAVDFEAPAWVRWQAAAWRNKLYLTNRLSPVQTWDGRSSSLAELAAPAPKGKTIEQYQNHLLLGDVIDVDGNATDGLAGSGLPDTGGDADWDYANNASDAFAQQILTRGDAIQRLARLNSYLAIYKEFSIHLLNYVGQPSVYTIQQATDVIGMVSPWALERLPMYHVFAGQDDLYQFNGTMPQGFGVRVWKYLVELCGTTALGSIWTFHAVQNREIIFALPTGKALVWNYEYDAFTTRDWTYTAAGYIPASPKTIAEHTEPISEWVTPIADDVSFAEFYPLAGDANGRLWQLEGGTFAGTATAESGDMAFGRPDMVKLINGLDVDFGEVSGYYPLKVYVGVRDSLKDAVTWQGPYETRALRRVNFMASGVWFRFKFVKQGGFFSMRAYTPFVRIQGPAIMPATDEALTLVDATAADAPIDYELTLNNPLTAITVGASVNATFVASGGTAPYTYAGSGLPAGLSLATDGVVTGVTWLVGTFPYTVTATDARGATVTREYELVVSPYVLTLDDVLPDGTEFAAYTGTVTASGGIGPYTYALVSGSLPGGLSLNASTGEITGTPTTAETATFTIAATDANGFIGSRAYSVTVAEVVLTLDDVLPDGSAGVAYTGTVTATGGTGPYTYAVTSGALPAGLSLSSGGAVTGTPTTAATSAFTITATDANGSTGNRAYSVTVAEAIGDFSAPITVTPTTEAHVAEPRTAYSPTPVSFAKSGGTWTGMHTASTDGSPPPPLVVRHYFTIVTSGAQYAVTYEMTTQSEGNLESARIPVFSGYLVNDPRSFTHVFTYNAIEWTLVLG